jgi:hypothetical protein
MTGYGLDSWVPSAGERDFSLLQSIYTSSEAHRASYPMGTRGSFPRSRQTGHEADHSSPSNAKVKNGGAIPPLPHMYLQHDA